MHDVWHRLMEQYRDWKGTRYRRGGLSKRGIDCSGFTHLTFKTRLGMELPRSTEAMARMGVRVTKNHLRTGDLVFFKVGILSRHVGIFLRDAQFLHVSSTKGVMISSLHDAYWARRYWLSRRVL